MALFVWPPQNVNTSGLATEAKQDVTNTKLDTIAGYVDGIEGALTTLNAKDFATEATLAKTRKWPYATHAKIVPTSDVNNEYYTYKTSGDVTVGTITKAKATGIITFSPDKAY